MSSADIKFWRYYIPSIDGMEGWGVFLLDSTGMFSAVTDYGNAAYKFDVRQDEDIRKYFAKGAPGGLLEKLFYDLRRYDFDETLQRVQEHILESRRLGSFTRDEARAEWNRLEDYAWIGNEADFTRWFDDTSIDDASEFYTLGYPAS